MVIDPSNGQDEGWHCSSKCTCHDTHHCGQYMNWSGRYTRWNDDGTCLDGAASINVWGKTRLEKRIHSMSLEEENIFHGSWTS